MSDFELSEYKLTQVLDHLRTNPGDYAGAAKLVQLTRQALEEHKVKNPEPFAKIENEYYDLLESLIRKSALGVALPDGYENFNFQRAITILRAGRTAQWAVSHTARAAAKSEAARNNPQDLEMKYDPYAPLSKSQKRVVDEHVRTLMSIGTDGRRIVDPEGH